MQKHPLPLSAISVALLLCHALPAHAQATFPLNDTGQNQCYDGSTKLAPCTESNTGDLSTYPRQDGRFGRDARKGAGQLTKIGGGDAGFDFTALDATGNPTQQPDHVCVRDNQTQLIWSTETMAKPMDWKKAMKEGTAYNRCGLSTGWRLPTVMELLSIVNRGKEMPAIDSNSFPNTKPSYYWSSDAYAPDKNNYAWAVYFDYGGVSYFGVKTNTIYVRLVHDKL